jgi:hypothetical protein
MISSVNYIGNPLSSRSQRPVCGKVLSSDAPILGAAAPILATSASASSCDVSYPPVENLPSNRSRSVSVAAKLLLSREPKLLSPLGGTGCADLPVPTHRSDLRPNAKRDILLPQLSKAVFILAQNLRQPVSLVNASVTGAAVGNTVML